MRKDRILNMLEASPKDSFLHFALAKEYENEENWAKAIEEYEWIRSNEPKYVGMYYHLGAAAIEDEREETYIREAYEQGITIAKEQKDNHALAELQNSFMNWEMEL